MAFLAKPTKQGTSNLDVVENKVSVFFPPHIDIVVVKIRACKQLLKVFNNTLRWEECVELKAKLTGNKLSLDVAEKGAVVSLTRKRSLTNKEHISH